MIEECWFIEGKRVGPFLLGKRVYHSFGSTTSVNFDWNEAVSKKVLGFYHTHPFGEPFLSDEDITTMKAWVRAEGRPLICGVICSGVQSCWIFYRKGKYICYRKIPSFLNRSLYMGWVTSK